jgi:hypothetical protein
MWTSSYCKGDGYCEGGGAVLNMVTFGRDIIVVTNHRFGHAQLLELTSTL